MFLSHWMFTLSELTVSVLYTITKTSVPSLVSFCYSLLVCAGNRWDTVYCVYIHTKKTTATASIFSRRSQSSYLPVLRTRTNLSSCALDKTEWTRTRRGEELALGKFSSWTFSCSKFLWTVLFLVLRFWGRDSSVGIATRYGLDGLGIESWWGRDFPHPSRPDLGPTQPPVQWVPG